MIFLAGFSCAQLTLMLHAELLACTLPLSEILPFFSYMRLVADKMREPRKIPYPSFESAETVLI